MGKFVSRTVGTGFGVGVEVGVGEGVSDTVGVGDGVDVERGANVATGVATSNGVAVGAMVGNAVGTRVDVGRGAGAAVGRGIGVNVGVTTTGVAVGVGSDDWAVGTVTGVGVAVEVGSTLGVTEASGSSTASTVGWVASSSRAASAVPVPMTPHADDATMKVTTSSNAHHRMGLNERLLAGTVIKTGIGIPNARERHDFFNPIGKAHFQIRE